MPSIGMPLVSTRIGYKEDKGKVSRYISDKNLDLMRDLFFGLYDVSKAGVAIIGQPQSGKTYLLEQVLENPYQFMDSEASDYPLNYIRITPNILNEVLNSVENGVPGMVDSFLEAGADPESLCLVTGNKSVARVLADEARPCRVLLETDISEFFGEDLGDWGDFTFIDTSDLVLTKKELCRSIYHSTDSSIRLSHGRGIQQTDVKALVEYFLEQVPEAVYPDDYENKDKAGKVMVPPGVWSESAKHLAKIRIFNSLDPRFLDEKRHFNLEKALEDVYAKNSEDFNLYVSNQKILDATRDSEDADLEDGLSVISLNLDGSVEELEEGLRQILGQPAKSKKKAKKGKPEKPPVFKDFANLRNRLGEKVFGQDEILEKVTNSLSIPVAGLNDKNKPLRSFLFLGTSGVGKTKLAQTLSEELYETKQEMLRLDMSEFSEKHTSMKLFGAPPSYVGYEQGGVLTNFAKEHPYGIILLDEVEKAYPEVWDSFLQVFDAGRMTDGQGETADFSNNIFIMTSNLGSNELNRKKSGFQTMSEEEMYRERQENAKNVIMRELEHFFRVEFINRIDDIVVFNELKPEFLRKIVKNEVNLVFSRLEDCDVSVSDPVLSWIEDKSEIQKFGVREIQRVVNDVLSQKLARFVIANPKVKKMRVSIKSGEVAVSKA